jgi:hypothetical protein
MTARNQIAEALISCRNFLVAGRTNEHVLPSLEAVLADLDSITVLYTRNIVKHCVAEAISQIRAGDLLSAGMILNLIHNFPLDESARHRWDIDYFLSIELTTFLERYAEIKSARVIVLRICAELATQYVPGNG